MNLHSEVLEELRSWVCESLLDFTNTEIYKNIPKSKSFLAFCIDHDESFEEAMDRLNLVKEVYLHL